MAYGRGADGVREVEQAAALLAADPEIARTLITHRFPWTTRRKRSASRVTAASGAIKVALHP